MGHVQIRNVPDDVHRTLKARAAESGMSLSDYLLVMLRRSAAVPTTEELVERVRSRKLYDLGVEPADLIREDRERR
ncbi:MAG: FitA-like ribbon-helix-helix domain-containing protein [Gaiellaceae bacterium]